MKKKKAIKIKLTKERLKEIEERKRAEKIAKIEFRWPKDDTVYRRYTLRCQKCGARIPLEIKYGEKYTKKGGKKTEIDLFSFWNSDKQEVYASIPTIQFKNQSKNTEENGYLCQVDIITSELNNYKRLLDSYWFSHNKSIIQRIYKKNNNPNNSIKGVLCDGCYELEKLKE